MKIENRVQRGQTNPGNPVTPDSVARREIPSDGLDAEFRRRMTNWSIWRSGASISLAASTAYDPALHESNYDECYPLMNGDAVDVEEAVLQLPPELRNVVEAYWVGRGSNEQKARSCKCAIRTYWRRLDHAHVRIQQHLSVRRARHRRAA
jgi:DNA-directed RNA polymerase specialized sigma24 family protein